MDWSLVSFCSERSSSTISIRMAQDTSSTRMIALGSPALARGFRLIGFEALENPNHQEASTLIKELQVRQQRAFMVVEQSLADDMRDLFAPIQQEGGDILMVELPSIHEPEKLDSYLAEGIVQKLGPNALKQEAV